MLQARDLVKRYAMKGNTVTALGGVSIDFPEKGMVFLLGKSGSGKSTLLNVLGGLDVPDEGEIVINGKSSRDFSESDYNSYRNTFIGFVFQEYNVLGELTVFENVAFSVELQGETVSAEKISAILKEVDLEGFETRRPNTLSGGQKQRVAIARALVKNPEIILADEPTGALDSVTGRQVLETLKRLSAQKLVIVVSHDREFAQNYGDRVIELADGKIVSDASPSPAKKPDLNFFEEETRAGVRNGRALTEEEGARILAFIKSHAGPVVFSKEKAPYFPETEPSPSDMVPPKTLEPVSSSEELPSSEPSLQELSEPAEKERPSAADRTQTPSEGKTDFIRSRLPLRYAFKIGLSGLRLKPLRLVFTTLLATMAFLIFGIFSTLVTFSPADIGAKTLLAEDYTAAVLTKYGVLHCRNGNATYERKVRTSAAGCLFSPAEIDELRADYPDAAFIPASTNFHTSIDFKFSLGFAETEEEFRESNYYGNTESVTAFALASDAKAAGLTLLAGEWPKDNDVESATIFEIALSKAAFETFRCFDFRERDDYDPLKWIYSDIDSYEDLIGKEITVTYKSNGAYTRDYLVAGIVDTGEDFSKFEPLKRKNDSYAPDEWDRLKTDLYAVYRYSLASLVYVPDNFPLETSRAAVYVTSSDRMYLESSNFLVWNKKTGTYQSSGADMLVSEQAEASDACYDYIFAPLNEASARAVMERDSRKVSDVDTGYETPYPFMNDVRKARSNIQTAFPLVGGVAAALALFAAFLLYNFISVSINAKKHDIGVLRATGASGRDIWHIFLAEGGMITLFCFALGVLGAFGACALANYVLLSKGISVFKILLFRTVNVLFVLALALATGLVSTAIPVRLAVKKRPVEAIRAL